MYDVLGMGMECSKSKTKWILCKTIFGGYYKSSDITYIKLSRNDCLHMKINKICAIKDNGETLKLQCNGDVCSTEEKVLEPLLIHPVGRALVRQRHLVVKLCLNL